MCRPLGLRPHYFLKRLVTHANSVRQIWRNAHNEGTCARILQADASKPYGWSLFYATEHGEIN
jgi:hypothetical protein